MILKYWLFKLNYKPLLLRVDSSVVFKVQLTLRQKNACKYHRYYLFKENYVSILM